jgi:NTP pyrophosphatase (non-canonical NTP hydrolase)
MNDPQLQNQHTILVDRLKKPDQAILENLHMILGIVGEAGELCDAIKKHVIYDKPLDRANVVEELGDLEFFMEGLRQRLAITRDETLKGNKEKLTKRYPMGLFTNEDAQRRADKIYGLDTTSGQ